MFLVSLAAFKKKPPLICLLNAFLVKNHSPQALFQILINKEFSTILRDLNTKDRIIFRKIFFNYFFNQNPNAAPYKIKEIFY